MLNNFAALSKIVFSSFAGLGLKASGATLTATDLMRPGFVAATGYTASEPLLTQAGNLMGFTSFFNHVVTILVLVGAWFIVVLAFFILAVQLFITILEFKLTTLAGFVLVPFALWNKTSFLAERVLGNVVSTGVKAVDGETYEVTGDLTLRGVTNPVTLTVEVEGAGIGMDGSSVLSLKASGEVNRNDYGISWGASLDNGAAVVAEKVRLVLTVEAVKAGE